MYSESTVTLDPSIILCPPALNPESTLTSPLTYNLDPGRSIGALSAPIAT